MKPRTILGIESSCDDTSAALIKRSSAGFEVLSEITASQIEIHKQYGGVVPEIAGRKHAEQIIPVIQTVLDGHPRPDAIAVTAGPGLMTGLLVGVEAAKTLSYLWDIPLIRTNHIEGHIYSVLLPEDGAAPTNMPNIAFPALCLIASGGHTEFILMKDHGVYEKIGGTRDDAVGEAFDKVAKMLDLEYPGGPKISKFAETGNSKAIQFPRPMINDASLDMSFSGLKTAALYWLRDNELTTNFLSKAKDPVKATTSDNSRDPSVASLTQENTIHDFCASFEQAITDVLVSKATRAIELHGIKTLTLSGGVSANNRIRASLQAIASEHDITYMIPPKKYCMDNGTMIAAAGYMQAMREQTTTWSEIVASPVWRIYE